MSFASRQHTSQLRHVGRRVRIVLTIAVGFAFGGVGVQAALAAGTPFERGDLFFGGMEYSPTGQLQHTYPAVGQGCFDPSGKHLISPGAGLFDTSGNPQPSNWASVSSGHCVADGFGNVYALGLGFYGDTVSNIGKYDLKGNLLHTFTVPTTGGVPLDAIDLAPDECTIYTGFWNGLYGTVGRLNACTNTVESPAIPQNAPADDLRVLPDWQVLVQDDAAARLFDSSGQPVRNYAPSNPFVSNTLRMLTLDPDGTSFWMAQGSGNGPGYVFRFDINTGTQLAAWQGPGGLGPVYGPPFLGDADVENNVDDNPAGTAEAFPTRVRFSGRVTRLHLYVDTRSTASQVSMGIYSDKNGNPGTLLNQTVLTNLRAGSWNYAQVPSTSVAVGQRVWIAILSPNGAGIVRFRDLAHSAASSQTSAQHRLTALPARWSSGTRWATGSLSAYGS